MQLFQPFLRRPSSEKVDQFLREMEKFIITKDSVKKVKRFNLQGRTLEFKIKPIPEHKDTVEWVKSAINQVIERGTENLRAGDQVGFSFCSKDFTRGEGWIRFQPIEKVTFDHVWDVIASVYQSNSSGLNTETFCLGITSVRMPSGRGRGKNYNSFQEECLMRRGLVSINNKDNMCLPRALVVSKAYVDKDPAYRTVRKDTRKMQTQRAIQLMKDADVTISESGAGIPELERFQLHLQHYKIVVYAYGGKGRNVIFAGVNEGPTLNLLYNEGHYNVITSLTSAFCCDYYCEVCHVPYNTKENHKCGGTCPCCCQSPSCPQDRVKIKCDDCKRSFRGQTCYDNHKNQEGKNSVCTEIVRCEHCFKTVRSSRQHICGEIFCKICYDYVPADHLCYMQPNTGKPVTDNILFIFYDLETIQEKVLEDGSLLHEPNLCVFKQCCDSCFNTEEKNCGKCGPRLQILKVRPVERFLEFVLNQRKIFKNVAVLAHNGQAFDHQFILNHILTKTDLKPELIMRGTKLIMIKVGNVKFLDSLNYFPMALSKLPKAFGLGDNFKKGYFPHLFNTSVNEKYVGSIPPIEYYDPDNMKEEAREMFLKWYGENKNYEFDMQKEIVEYCISDVEILAAACLKFRQQLLDTGNVCPFTEACTIASACNRVFRRNFLRPNTIGIIPKNGYRWRDNQSIIATQWLVWEEKQRHIYIQHAAKQMEARVHGVKVDGFCLETNQIFEFYGCYFHACPCCFKHGRNDPLHEDPSETLNLRYEATMAKTDRLRNLGYDVIEMWECGFRKQIAQNSEIREYSENHPLVTSRPLNPRDSFYGGRTGNTFKYYKIKDDEKIKYVDICSLYPWACKYGKFPIGHPKVFVGEECTMLDLNTTDGLIKCKILPPQELYHPVLPIKMNDKLMFVLCRTCGQTMNQSDCNHTTEERALVGSWVIDEVLKALEKGYKILQTYEIWSYTVQQFDKSKNVAGLFTAMMNKFIKIKQQASGFPKHCNTREKQEKYIEQFLEREDVNMEIHEIIENPGLRSLAKLILNSFWGKFGQKENQPKTKIINSPEEFFNMFTNSAILINSALDVNDNTVVVNYEMRDEVYDPLTTVNVVIAAYVTTHARLKLYSYLEKLEDRVLYYDTDSVIYISRPEEFDIPTGEFIGDMTDELESYGVNSYIIEFASGGPKNYAYLLYSPVLAEYHEVCKVKGIALTYSASQLVNFKTLKEKVLESSEPVYIHSKNIRRTREHEVITRKETKIYRPNSTKRKFLDDYGSVPYGYKKLKLV